MTTEVTAPPTPERRPSPKPRPPAADKPTTTLTIPAKPAAATAANALAITGTAVAATGPVGVAVATVVAGGAVAGYAVHRLVVRRSARNRAAAAALGSGGGLAFPGGSGRRGGKNSGAGRDGAGRTGGAGSGRSRSLLDRLGLGSRRKSTAGPGSSGGSKAGGAARSALGKTGAAARQMWNAAKAAKKEAAARRAAKKAAKSGASDGSGSKTKTPSTWGRMRKFVRRNVLGQKDEEKKQPKDKTTTPGRKTGDKVRRPAQPATTEQRERGQAPKPVKTRNTERIPPMSNQTPRGQQGSTPFWAAARQVHATAAQHKPKGMLARRLEAYEMPASLGEIAAGLRLLATTHTSQEPLEPAYAAAVMQIAATVESAAQAARHLAPAFDALHSVQVRRLLQPKVNEGAWDTINNKP